MSEFTPEFFAQKFGLSLAGLLSDTEGYFRTLVDAFTSANEDGDKAAEKAAEGIKAKREKCAAENAEAVNMGENFVHYLAEKVWPNLVENPATAIGMLAALDNLKSVLQDIERIALDRLAIDETPDTGTAANPAELAAQAKWARDQINSVRTLPGITVPDFVPAEMPLKRGRKAGEDSGAGRYAAAYRFQWNLNGEEFPARISLRDVAFKCSTPDNFLTAGDLEKILGEGWSGKDDHSVTVPAGTLTGTKVQTN